MAAENFKIHYDQEDEYNASTFYSQHTLDLRPDGTCTLMYVYHYDDTHGQGFFKPRFVDEMYAQLFRNERGRYSNSYSHRSCVRPRCSLHSILLIAGNLCSTAIGS